MSRTPGVKIASDERRPGLRIVSTNDRKPLGVPLRELVLMQGSANYNEAGTSYPCTQIRIRPNQKAARFYGTL